MSQIYPPIRAQRQLSASLSETNEPGMPAPPAKVSPMASSPPGGGRRSISPELGPTITRRCNNSGSFYPAPSSGIGKATSISLSARSGQERHGQPQRQEHMTRAGGRHLPAFKNFGLVVQ